MRNLHRWVSTAAMLFLTWVAVTGVVLALDGMFPPAGLDEAGAGGPPGGGGMGAAVSLDTSGDVLPRADIAAYVATSVHAALASNPGDLTALQVQVSMQGGEVRAMTDVEPSAAGRAVTVADAPWYNDLQTRLRLHDLIQDLHRGNIIGISGQVMDVLTGFCFIFLSVTGTIMFFQMRTRRKQQGRTGWFWK